MKFYLLIFLTILVSLIVQLLVMGYLSICGAGPQILLVSVIFLSLRYGPLFGEIYGFIAGLFLDTFAISVFGINSLVFTMVGYVYGNLSRRINESRILVQVLLAFVASYLHVGFRTVASAVFASEHNIFSVSVVAGPIYTTLLAPLLVKIYSIWISIIEKWSGKTNLI